MYMSDESFSERAIHTLRQFIAAQNVNFGVDDTFARLLAGAVVRVMRDGVYAHSATVVRPILVDGDYKVLVECDTTPNGLKTVDISALQLRNCTRNRLIVRMIAAESLHTQMHGRNDDCVDLLAAATLLLTGAQ